MCWWLVAQQDNKPVDSCSDIDLKVPYKICLKELVLVTTVETYMHCKVTCEGNKLTFTCKEVDLPVFLSSNLMKAILPLAVIFILPLHAG